MAEAGLRRRSRLATATLLVAANLPDLDVLVFATSTPSVEFRRGWTHGLPAQVLLPMALTLAMVAVDAIRQRRRPAVPAGLPLHPAWLLVLACAGVWSHVGLDLLNNYGVRLLMPFDTRWFYGDTLFIVDPWMWLSLGLGVWLARRRGAPQPARMALVTATIYVLVMVVSARTARTMTAAAWVESGHPAPVSLMVGPEPVTPFRKVVVLDAGDRYVTGRFDWLPPRVRFDAETVAKNLRPDLVAQARETAAVRSFLIWSRFPVWAVESTGPGVVRVTVGDMRFRGGPVRFGASATVPVRGPTDQK